MKEWHWRINKLYKVEADSILFFPSLIQTNDGQKIVCPGRILSLSFLVMLLYPASTYVDPGGQPFFTNFVLQMSLTLDRNLTGHLN